MSSDSQGKKRHKRPKPALQYAKGIALPQRRPFVDACACVEANRQESICCVGCVDLANLDPTTIAKSESIAATGAY